MAGCAVRCCVPPKKDRATGERSIKHVDLHGRGSASKIVPSAVESWLYNTVLWPPNVEGAHVRPSSKHSGGCVRQAFMVGEIIALCDRSYPLKVPIKDGYGVAPCHLPWMLLKDGTANQEADTMLNNRESSLYNQGKSGHGRVLKKASIAARTFAPS